jgi:hypothetical protein
MKTSSETRSRDCSCSYDIYRTQNLNWRCMKPGTEGWPYMQWDVKISKWTQLECYISKEEFCEHTTPRPDHDKVPCTSNVHILTSHSCSQMAKKRLSFLLVKDQKQRALGVGVSPLEPALRTEKIKLIEVDPRCRFHWKEFGSPGFSTRVLHSPPPLPTLLLVRGLR